MPYYDPTANIKNRAGVVSDKVKVLALERLVRNLYHCKEILYDIRLSEEGEGLPSDLFGTIYMVNLNDDPFKAPKLHDCCDDLEYEVFTRIVDDEYDGKPNVEIGLEVGFYGSDKIQLEEIRVQREKVKELFLKQTPDLNDSNCYPSKKDEGT